MYVTGTVGPADTQRLPASQPPPFPAKRTESQHPQTLPWHPTHLCKGQAVNDSSAMLSSERTEQKAELRSTSLPPLGGVQFFFKWDRDNPLTRLYFLGQRVFHNIRSDDINVSRQVVQHAFHNCCWCIKIHQEIPAMREKCVNCL